MKRFEFIKYLTLLPVISKAMGVKELKKLSESLTYTQKMPLLFLGHGSPMNAIYENKFVDNFKKLGEEIQKPKAIICISAHWETKGTFVTAMEKPKTIHDFGGFPQELFDVQYPANGSPELAIETQKIIKSTTIGLDHDWGLDHGSWSVIKHLYPNADIPVIQMSLDYSKPAKYHFELAQELAVLRQKGVLIIGSGNMVHNLRMVARDKSREDTYGYDWAIEANEKMKASILNGDFERLVNFRNQGKAFDLAIPTPEHYLPLLYTLAMKDKTDKTDFFNDQLIRGSLSMTSVKFE